MVSRRWMFTAVLLAAAAFSAGLFAQQPQRELLLVYEDHVKPSQTEAYESSMKDLLKALSEAKASSPSFEMMAFAYEDFTTYCYLTPLKGYGALDGMESDWMKVAEKVGKERWKKLMEANAPTTEGYSEMLAEHLPALSFAPAVPRLKESEMPYFVDYYYYVIPGKEGEFKALAKQFVDLYKSKGITNGWDLYQCLVGESLPFFVVGHGAKDAADFAAWDLKDTAAMGDEGKALFAKVLGVCRKIETRPGWWRPDLSYHVPSPETTQAEPSKKK